MNTNKNKIWTICIISALVCTLSPTSVFPANNTKAQKKEYSSWSDSMTKNMKPFIKYGLRYDKEQDAIYYNDKRVKAFVDFKDTIDGGGYWFNIGFNDKNTDSTLYLKSIRDDSGNITGIEKMPESLIDDLYGDDIVYDDESYDDFTDKITNKKSSKSYYAFDATVTLENNKIKVTDKLTDKDIPDNVQKWVTDYYKTEKAGLIKSDDGKQIDVWFCYGGETRLLWNIETEETTLKLYLYDYTNSDPIKGSTIINYKAPSSYDKLEVYLNDVILILI